MQVLCGLQGIFLLFNCQTPVMDMMSVPELEEKLKAAFEEAEQ